MIFPSSPNGQNDQGSSDPSANSLPSELSLSQQKKAKQQASKWFFILLLIGLVLGGLLSFGVVKLLQEFGLTARPNHPLRIQPYQN